VKRARAASRGRNDGRRLVRAAHRQGDYGPAAQLRSPGLDATRVISVPRIRVPRVIVVAPLRYFLRGRFLYDWGTKPVDDDDPQRLEFLGAVQADTPSPFAVHHRLHHADATAGALALRVVYVVVLAPATLPSSRLARRSTASHEKAGEKAGDRIRRRFDVHAGLLLLTTSSNMSVASLFSSLERVALLGHALVFFFPGGVFYLCHPETHSPQQLPAVGLAVRFAGFAESWDPGARKAATSS